LRFGFEATSLTRIVAVTDPDNRSSQHVLGKCGMRPIGPRRAYGEDDVPWFEVTRVDWQAQASNQWPSGSPGQTPR
jgi:ribosomal-protein-alanine N-acetyltransferase